MPELGAARRGGRPAINNGTLAYRVGGKTYNAGRTAASVRTGWHKFTLTVSQGNTTLYVDGTTVHSSTGGDTADPVAWHVLGEVEPEGHLDELPAERPQEVGALGDDAGA